MVSAAGSCKTNKQINTEGLYRSNWLLRATVPLPQRSAYCTPKTSEIQHNLRGHKILKSFY